MPNYGYYDNYGKTKQKTRRVCWLCKKKTEYGIYKNVHRNCNDKFFCWDCRNK